VDGFYQTLEILMDTEFSTFAHAGSVGKAALHLIACLTTPGHIPPRFPG